MGTAAQTIDGALGRGWYGEWQELERRREAAGPRLERYERQLAAIHADKAAEQFLKDSFWLAKIARDYRQGLDLIAKGNRLDPREVGQIHDLYTIALGVVELDNELCQGLFAGLMAIGFTLFPLGLLQYKAERLRRLTLQLKAELERAAKQVREADAQLAINTALSVVSLALPEISVLAKGALFFGQLVSDQLLGSQSAVYHAGVGTAAQGVSAFADATEKVEILRTSTAARVARSRAFGAGASFLGFTSDLDEVFATYRYKDRVAKALKQTEEAYDSLMADIRRYKHRLRGLKIAIQRWAATMNSRAAEAARVRKLLEAESRRIRYPSGFLPYQWRSLVRRT